MSYSSRIFSAYNKKKLAFVYIALLPVMGWMFIFNIYPIIYAFYLSLFERAILGIGAMKFVGLTNYAKVLFTDEIFWLSLTKTIYFTGLTLFIHLPLTFLVALGLYKIARRYRSTLLVCYFSPIVIGMVVAAVIFIYLYDPNVGFFNTVLGFLGLPKLYYIYEPSTALVSLFIVNSWLYIGFDAVIWLVALQNIPKEISDSAQIDGAKFWQRTFYITLPLIKPIGLFLVITTVIGTFQIFSLVFVLTPDGGPLKSTYVLMFYIYKTAFQYYHINYACALTYIVFIVILGVTILQLKIGKSSWRY